MHIGISAKLCRNILQSLSFSVHAVHLPEENRRQIDKDKDRDLKSSNGDVFWMPVNSQIIGWAWIQSGGGDKGAFGRDMYIFGLFRGVSNV